MDEPFPPPLEDPAGIARQIGTGHQGQNCVFGAAEIEAIERVCAFIDTLCEALLAAFMPRTWFGQLFRRRVVDPLAQRICAALGGMRDRLREIAAEGFGASAQAPATRGGDATRGGVGRTSGAPCAERDLAGNAAHGAALMRPTGTEPPAEEIFTQAQATHGGDATRGGVGRTSGAACAERGAAPKAAHDAALMRPTSAGPAADAGVGETLGGVDRTIFALARGGGRCLPPALSGAPSHVHFVAITQRNPFGSPCHNRVIVDRATP